MARPLQGRRRPGQETDPLGGRRELAVPGGLSPDPAGVTLQRALRFPHPRGNAGGGQGQSARAVAAFGREGAGRVVQGDPDGGPRVEAAGSVARCGGGGELAAGYTGTSESVTV